MLKVKKLLAIPSSILGIAWYAQTRPLKGKVVSFRTWSATGALMLMRINTHDNISRAEAKSSLHFILKQL